MICHPLEPPYPSSVMEWNWLGESHATHFLLCIYIPSGAGLRSSLLSQLRNAKCKGCVLVRGMHPCKILIRGLWGGGCIPITWTNKMQLSTAPYKTGSEIELLCPFCSLPLWGSHVTFFLYYIRDHLHLAFIYNTE